MGNDYKNVISNKKAEAKTLMTEEQIKKCNIVIHSSSVAAGAGGVIPVPVADAVPITAAQITMIVALGKIFDLKISDSAAKAIIGAAASTLIGRSLFKLIPVAGLVVSAVVAAGVTEAIGWTAAVDFAKQALNSGDGSGDEEKVKSDSRDVMVSDINKNFDNCSIDDPDNLSSSETDKGEFEKTENDEDSDNESMSKDFLKMFEEDE